MAKSLLDTAIVRRARGVGLCCVALIVGCTSGQQPPASPDTRAADEAAIRKLDADWVKAGQSGKVDAWLAFYADDAVVLPPNDKVASGKDAIRRPVAEMLALPGLALSWRATRVEVARSGDLAYLTGAYELTFNDPAGKPVADQGKLVEIWKKQPDGSWKCIVDTWNSDMPATAPAK